MNKQMKGRVWKFGHNVDTDHIIPTKYLISLDPMEQSTHCFENVRPEFGQKRRDGDIIVAGKNFGCGSSRQAAPLVIQNRGIACIIAESYARLFLRNAVNLGLPLVVLKDAAQKIDEGDVVIVDLEKDQVINQTQGYTYDVEKTPDFLMEIYENGGLEGTIAKKMARQKSQEG